MSDADLIDTKRPWIEDPQDAPSEMKWIDSFVDPTGETSRVHFTRGWTALFFARLLFFVGTSAFVFIMMSAGAKDPQAFAPPPWAFPVLIVITALMSLVLHIRRLANARRNPLWASIVMLPVIIGVFGFMGGAQQGAADYAAAVEAQELRLQGVEDETIALRLDRPGAYELLASELVLAEERRLMQAAGSNPGPDALSRGLLDNEASLTTRLGDRSIELEAGEQDKLREAIAAKLETRREAEPDPERDVEAVSKELRGLRRQWESKLPGIAVSEVSARDHALQTALGQAQTLWAPPSLLVMVWTLLWVARLPNGGGSIRSRFDIKRPYEAD